MLRLIQSQESTEPPKEVLRKISTGAVDSSQTWVETTALLVTECQGASFGRYFMLVITSEAGLDEAAELNRLSTEIGKSLSECVVERMRIQKPHSLFPGSRYFDLVTVYGG